MRHCVTWTVHLIYLFWHQSAFLFSLSYDNLLSVDFCVLEKVFRFLWVSSSSCQCISLTTYATPWLFGVCDTFLHGFFPHLPTSASSPSIIFIFSSAAFFFFFKVNPPFTALFLQIFTLQHMPKQFVNFACFNPDRTEVRFCIFLWQNLRKVFWMVSSCWQ